MIWGLHPSREEWERTGFLIKSHPDLVVIASHPDDDGRDDDRPDDWLRDAWRRDQVAGIIRLTERTIQHKTEKRNA